MPHKIPFLKVKLLLQQIIFFAIIEALAIFAGYRLLFAENEESEALRSALSPRIELWQFILAFFLATALIIFLVRFLRAAGFLYFVFELALAFGIFIVLSQMLPLMIAALITALILIVNAFFAKIWSHNLVIILGIAGISANLGLSLPLFSVLVILTILSVYDFIAVYKTRHMQKMFYGLLKKGIILSVIVPNSPGRLTSSFVGVKPGGDYMFLGTGDLALPAIFAVSAFSEGTLVPILIAVGGVIGVIVTQLIFSLPEKRKPMPALPTISFFCVLAYLISTWI